MCAEASANICFLCYTGTVVRVRGATRRADSAAEVPSQRGLTLSTDIGLTAPGRAATIAAGCLAAMAEMTRRMSMLLALPLAFALPAPAGAHASLVRTIPARGSAVHKSPATVKLWFSERLEPAYSTVEVVGRDGKRVDNGDAGVDRADARLLQGSLPQLPAGMYRVTWRVLSVDTHVSEGQFSFEIAP